MAISRPEEKVKPHCPTNTIRSIIRKPTTGRPNGGQRTVQRRRQRAIADYIAQQPDDEESDDEDPVARFLARQHVITQRSTAFKTLAKDLLGFAPQMSLPHQTTQTLGRVWLDYDMNWRDPSIRVKDVDVEDFIEEESAIVSQPCCLRGNITSDV